MTTVGATPHLLLAATLALSLGSANAVSADDTADAKQSDANASDEAIEFRELLHPGSTRDESERDRLRAMVLVTHARLKFKRGDLSEALRKYQRAWRYDPNLVPLLKQVVPIAFRLNRQDEAARYAVIAAERAGNDANLLSQLAAVLVEQGNVKRAIRLYEKALELQGETKDSGSILIHFELGRLYLLNDQQDKSAATLAPVGEAFNDPAGFGLKKAELFDLFNKPELAMTLVAETALLKGKREAAGKLFAMANDHSPDKTRYALQQARVAQVAKKPEQALRHLETYFSLKPTPENDQPYRLLLRILEKTSPPGEAVNELLARLEKLHDDQPDLASLEEFLAVKLEQVGRREDALEHFERLRERNLNGNVARHLVDYYRRRGETAKLCQVLGQVAERGGSLSLIGKARLEELTRDKRLVSAALAAKLEDSDQYFAMALLALRVKDFKRADERMKLALAAEAADLPRVMPAWGIALLLADQYAKSAEVFSRAIEESIDPKSTHEFHYLKAGALSAAKKTDEAYEAAGQAIKLKPDSVRLRFRRAWILYNARRYEPARKAFEQLLKRYDENHKSTDVRDNMRETRRILSAICVHLGRMPEAEEWLEQVLDEYPDDVGAKNDLGYLWADQNTHLRRSLRMLTTAVKAEPDNSAYRDSLGWVLYRLGRYQDAVRELSRAAKDGDDGVVLDHLGDAYDRLKKRGKAVETWRRAAAAFADSEDEKRKKATEAKIQRYTQRDG